MGLNIAPFYFCLPFRCPNLISLQGLGLGLEHNPDGFWVWWELIFWFPLPPVSSEGRRQPITNSSQDYLGRAVVLSIGGFLGETAVFTHIDQPFTRFLQQYFLCSSTDCGSCDFGACRSSSCADLRSSSDPVIFRAGCARRATNYIPRKREPVILSSWSLRDPGENVYMGECGEEQRGKHGGCDFPC